MLSLFGAGRRTTDGFEERDINTRVHTSAHGNL